MMLPLLNAKALVAAILFLMTQFRPVTFAQEFIPAEPTTPKSEFGLTIRSSRHQSPQAELASFHVPTGFQVDLIASEPDILKPLNVAFDSRGRLWVTQTSLYPFPAKDGEKATDSILVLEDRNLDGQFEQRTIFADGLNIPIGVIPTEDGAICFSIPYLWKLTDTDRDGRCDERRILYGPFDTTRDTHGMVNSLRDGGDGWVYACHGFNNQSTVAGTDGHSISMTSGNVFRFRPDGSRIELFTQGQVNPFGMARDRWGNWFAADCHSKPISQLIRGGCYPSFGRPDDGLGFVPPMMEHLHGSTAIAGLAHTVNSSFPASMSDQLLSGNVMTCRINRNQLKYSGATANAIELPDLLTSDDSWFRPVDLLFGPDGHLYIADFYNKVIGHYEVPLDHPDRDRTSGRIWRIRWVGSPTSPIALNIPKQTPLDRTMNPSKQLQELAAMDWSNTDSAMSLLRAFDKLGTDSDAKSLTWLLEQCERVESASDPVLQQMYWIALRNSISKLPAEADGIVGSMIEAMAEKRTKLVSPVATTLLKVLPAVKSPKALQLAIRMLSSRIHDYASFSIDERHVWNRAIDRLSEFVDDENIDPFLLLLAAEKTPSTDSIDLKYGNRLLSIGLRQKVTRGVVSAALATASIEELDSIADMWLSDADSTATVTGWFSLSTGQDDIRPWPVEDRKAAATDSDTADAPGSISVFSSFPLGEKYMGRWATAPFAAPEEWIFSIVGHNGLPAKPDSQKNFARMNSIELATGETRELFRAYPPRSDQAKTIQWDLRPHIGKTLQFEVVDGDAGSSYAWIGVGALNTPGLAHNEDRRIWELTVSLVELLGLPSERDAPHVHAAIASSRLDDAARFRVLRSSLGAQHPVDVEILNFAIETQQWDLVEAPLKKAVSETKDDWRSEWTERYPVLFKRWPAAMQTRLVSRLSKFRDGAERFADWIDKGLLPPDVLGKLPSSWWLSLSDDVRPRIERWKSQLESRVDRSKQIEMKLEELKTAAIDIEVGKKVYIEKCAACHRLGSIGNVVGPQLEGVGNRGIERLGEDILWPDRNVDEAFRVTLMSMDGGETITGLVQERTDESVTIADQTGQKRVIRRSDIEREKKSEISLMPSNFGDVLSASELASLLEYLRSLSTNTKHP